MNIEFPTILMLVAIALVSFLVTALIVWWIWNSTFTDLFGFKRVSFWQSIKLLLLATILFGGGVVNYTHTETAAGPGFERKSEYYFSVP